MTRERILQALIFIGVVVGVAVAVGCVSSADAYCEASVACQNGTDADFDACAANFDTEAESAAEKGCSSEHDDLVSCLEDTAECQGGSYYSSGCQDETAAFTTCIQ